MHLRIKNDESREAREAQAIGESWARDNEGLHFSEYWEKYASTDLKQWRVKQRELLRSESGIEHHPE